VKKILLSFLIVFSTVGLLQASQASHPDDFAGCKDPDLFTRMTGFWIYRCHASAFDRFEFTLAAKKTEKVEGALQTIAYRMADGQKPASSLQIIRNFENATKAAGGSVVYEWDDFGLNVTLKLTREKSEAWVFIKAFDNRYDMTIIRKEAMKQDVVADAASLAGSIGESGRAAVYGIYFDTDRSDIKPESKPALDEIVKLLKNDAKLNLHVVGHTDNVGLFEHNMKLSQARAESVVNALVTNGGIASTRLKAYGVGSLAPVASNKIDEGRAKNRRVELVAQ
jgi:OOP family OmpA-OmpF porin